MKDRAPNAPTSVCLLEVIVSSVEDALEAELGGAGRLELVRSLEVGGLTPSFELVRQICQRVKIPLRVMLRCAESHTPSLPEVEILSKQAAELASLGIDGLVLGFLQHDHVDVDLTRRVLSHAPKLRATFHRAFDETTHPLGEIERLKGVHQVDRILTSGGNGPWETRLQRLASYQVAASPQIQILAGGGITRLEIEQLRAKTEIREFHSGRASRVPDTASGVVRTERVKELFSSLNHIPL